MALSETSLRRGNYLAEQRVGDEQWWLWAGVSRGDMDGATTALPGCLGRLMPSTEDKSIGVECGGARRGAHQHLLQGGSSSAEPPLPPAGVLCLSVFVVWAFFC